MTNTTKNIHEGRNVKRFREMLGIKQDALAFELGEDWNQQKISLLEQKQTIDTDLLQQISDTLKIPVEAFKSFNEEQAVNIISSSFDHGSVAFQKNENCTINPLEEIKRLHEEKIALYERMLKEKDEMMARMEQLIKEK